MIIYKTTNLINRKFYVGKDINNNPNYLGSGLRLKRAIKKYSKENFAKEILEVCKSEKQLSEQEKYWIKETKAIETGYNIAEGGYGGWLGDKVNKKRKKSLMGHKISEETKRKIGNANKGNSYKTGKKISKQSRKLISLNHADISGEKNPMFNKKHSKETIELMRRRASGRFSSKWYIDKYGEEVGYLEYKKHNKLISDSRRNKIK